MSDQRICVTCGALIDIEHPHVTVLRMGKHRTVVRDDTTGLVHTVTTRHETEKRLAAQSAKEKE